MVDQGLHMVEVALRDSRNFDVILAADRLVRMPPRGDKAALRQTVEDMGVFKDFVDSRIPDSLYDAAASIFLEHKNVLMNELTEQNNAQG